MPRSNDVRYVAVRDFSSSINRSNEFCVAHEDDILKAAEWLVNELQDELGIGDGKVSLSLESIEVNGEQ